jgi:fatty-acyl-CoA synthase
VDQLGRAGRIPDVASGGAGGGVGVPDGRWQERPLATVVLKPGATVTAEELVEYLRPRVVKWWLPERWAFVDHVPKTSAGKFYKKVVRREYADGLLDVLFVR